MVRVYVCDDEHDVRLLTRILLEQDGDIVVVGEAGDAATAIRAAPGLEPHVVVLDFRLPDMDGPDLVRQVRAVVPGAAIVVHSGMDPSSAWPAAQAAGAARYVQKTHSLDELRSVVRETAESAGKSQDG